MQLRTYHKLRLNRDAPVVLIFVIILPIKSSRPRYSAAFVIVRKAMFMQMSIGQRCTAWTAAHQDKHFAITQAVEYLLKCDASQS